MTAYACFRDDALAVAVVVDVVAAIVSSSSWGVEISAADMFGVCGRLMRHKANAISHQITKNSVSEKLSGLCQKHTLNPVYALFI